MTNAPATAHPHLLAPLRVGGTTLANRMVMGAMHTRLETLDRPVERLSAFYAARARGGVGLILTGGYAPHPDGRMDPESGVIDDDHELDSHRAVCEAVHAEGSAIVLQLLHAGRYAKVPGCVGPSSARARINAHAPRALDAAEVWDVVGQFVRSAELASDAGYDGVEIMGSEGYLLNEFTSPRTNDRWDEFGGDLDGRLRLPVEIVRRTRERLGPDFLLVYRISAVDLVEDGLTGDEIAELARRVEAAGADVLNTGVGWHESAVPTIAASVPRAAWTFAVRRVKDAVGIPVIASNRINDPDVAEALLADGSADLVSMARPLLADPDFAVKVRTGRTDEINTCIACNQACLDRIFTDRTASCMVNPRAGHEIEFLAEKPVVRQRIAVVGGGPAGMAFALNAAERGHSVTLYDAAEELGGQWNLAKRVPGKAEFNQAIRYFRVRLERSGVDVRLGKPVEADELVNEDYDDIVLATGVHPRRPDIPGIGHAKVVSYADVLSGRVTPGKRVAVIGAGGIGFDTAEYLVGNPRVALEPETFLREWGVAAPDAGLRGDLAAPAAEPEPAHEVTLFQRKPERLGRGLGKSTGWILRSRLRKAGVAEVAGARYDAIDDEGLHYTVDGESRVHPCDTVVICAGQESDRTLHSALSERGVSARLIGGADVAAELDAVRAIDQATRLAVTI
ncbi:MULTISPECIES: oxidoreductase [Amycolatopsis]|uniref:FAD-dependent oxidoreductase n=1 Tax=Amycolatopsis echigonensis TaxID=2576905 RepID=A0A8E2AYS6_9PSEU|nr:MULTISPECIES: NADPH-dependent 2,4-dienoyl-CoA reductase [Amycolatopsis]MBB2498449.1 FAD-dependent oxidoreductase [Amycolatopsis echigonensis]